MVQEAADQGYADAMNDIGTLYNHGYGVPLDYAKALEWYHKAADLNDPTAMYNIGAPLRNRAWCYAGQ